MSCIGSRLKRYFPEAVPDKRLRLERRGSYDFAGSVHGSKSVYQFKVNFAGVYDRLVEGMCRFFEGGKPPAELRDIVENVAVMDAGNKSLRHGGNWIEVPAVQ